MPHARHLLRALATCICALPPAASALSLPWLPQTPPLVNIAHAWLVDRSASHSQPQVPLRTGRRLLGAHGGGGGLLWNGDPTNNWRDVFDNLNFSTETNKFRGSGTIRAFTERGLRMWRVHKPVGDKRAETRGAAGFSPTLGKTYYIGWRWRVTTRAPENSDLQGGVNVFQWKAYETARNGRSRKPVDQNYPFAMACVSEIRTLLCMAAVVEHGNDYKRSDAAPLDARCICAAILKPGAPLCPQTRPHAHAVPSIARRHR